MRTSPIADADIAASVWAVPPLALDGAGAPSDTENRALVSHIEAGGVSTILWGGNANIYGMTAKVFAAMAERIPNWVGAGTWAIPSVGPDYGKLMEHAAILKGSAYPAAMLLPYAGPKDSGGTEAAIREFVQYAGMPAILYLRQDGYLPVDRLAALVDDGSVVALKYAVETGDLTRDPYLDAVLTVVPAARIVSGIGELAAIPHLSTFRLAGFTAGAVCIAPRRAMAILRALQSGDRTTAETLARAIRPLEDLRMAHGPIPVIHDAITLSGIADMGLIRPHFSPLGAEVRAAVKDAIGPLLTQDASVSHAA